MSKWGIFASEDYSGAHVAPCGEGGVLLDPHVPVMECPCKPYRDAEEPRLVVHNDPERGGGRSGDCQ